MEGIILLFILSIILTFCFRFIALKIYQIYIHLTYSTPFGYSDVKFYTPAEDVIYKHNEPYRQTYLMREEEFYLYYRINVLDIDTNLIYLFTNENDNQLLTLVKLELECECYNDAKKVMGMLKEKIIKHYIAKPSFNEFVEDNKKKHFNNTFKIRNLDFEFDANARFLTLNIKLNTIYKNKDTE